MSIRKNSGMKKFSLKNINWNKLLRVVGIGAVAGGAVAAARTDTAKRAAQSGADRARTAAGPVVERARSVVESKLGLASDATPGKVAEREGLEKDKDKDK